LIDPATDPPLGRWATLKDAAGVLDTPPLDLLKQAKKGKRRATKIGNNWFVYLDPGAQAAAADRSRAAEEKKALRRKAVEGLRQENEQLRAQLAGARAEGPAQPEGIGRQLAPLLEGIERHHRSMTAEIEFLRSELVASRQQHAEEMRRKDILLQQAHKTLQDVVKLGLPAPKAAAAPAAAPKPAPKPQDVEQLREEQARMSRVMGEMSELLTLMYRRLRRPGE
jgi:pyruvate/2-oxoglutarate dehydrogenase complex dihydrolipoamide acyltransferase (E2) component